MVKKKKCSKCGKIKELSEFNKNRTTKDGFSGVCKHCRKLYRLKNKDYIINYRKNNNIKHKKQYKDYYLKNKNKIKDRCKVYQKSRAKYELYYEFLTFDESPRIASDGISLEVKCRYCGKYFIPSRRSVKHRIDALNKMSGSENSLYCSEYCKKACPIHGQIKYPKTYKKATSREVQPQLRQIVLERDNYTCQKCGKTTAEAELHCHHIRPLNESPIESADMGNCIILCKSCHKEAHKLPGCNYYELRCSE